MKTVQKPPSGTHRIFDKELAQLPSHVLTLEEITKVFEPLFTELENSPVSGTLPLSDKEILQQGYELSKKHHTAAYGYPATYMKVVGRKITRKEFGRMAKAAHAPVNNKTTNRV